ncbi:MULTISPECIES: hypothetical protein [Ectothiorhodospira]|nr:MULTISPECIES: hypothetical protein [Ectothiorhodospira]MCG5494218.1 hypothetical protein [Ectothiorhodospira variabilis]MCG5504836.1 hypothetical protein [Ectothiorhodospira variabilis]MCG5507993.1 hypothetical protein [Ectothiorhodospira variabilis]
MQESLLSCRTEVISMMGDWVMAQESIIGVGFLSHGHRINRRAEHSS